MTGRAARARGAAISRLLMYGPYGCTARRPYIQLVGAWACTAAGAGVQQLHHACVTRRRALLQQSLWPCTTAGAPPRGHKPWPPSKAAWPRLRRAAAMAAAASPRGGSARSRAAAASVDDGDDAASLAAHPGYGYALWLVPPAGSEAEARLRAAQRRLSPELPRHHPPHATIRCHLSSIQQARAVAAAVAAASPPIALSVAPRVEACRVRYAAPGAADGKTRPPPPSVDCRAVHAAGNGAGFEAACRAAHAAAVAWHLAAGGADAEAPGAFAPHDCHFSLAYRYAAAEYSVAEVARMDAAANGAAACCFVADRVVVASTHGPWPDWRVIEAVPMRAADWAAAPAEAAAPPGAEDIAAVTP